MAVAESLDFREVGFFKDVPTFGAFVSDVAENLPEGWAEGKYNESVAGGKALLVIGEQTKAEYESLSQSINQLSARLVALRKENESATEPAFMDALSNPEADTQAYATAVAARAQQISFIVDAIEYAREYLLPARLLHMLKTQYEMSRGATVLVTWQAVVSGVARDKAAAALVEAEGNVLFMPTGRTHDLFMQSHDCQMRASRAYDAWQSEVSRQKERNKLKGIL